MRFPDCHEPSESRDPLRVLYVIPGTEMGTGMSFSRRQAASVSRFDIEVKTFYLRSRTSPVIVWKELQRLRAEIRAFAPNVVHAHFGTMTALVSTIASPVPVVITFHGSDLNPAPRVSRLRSILGRAMSHWAARRADRVICVSTQLGQRLSYLKQRVEVIPCGVNTRRFHPMSRQDCRTQLGWNASDPVVLFNARTDPRGKRLDLAEACVAHARKTISNLRLHVFRGTTHPDEMPIYYSAANALLLTSDYEGSPMVVKEAMACNLPVVSVDVGDVAERLAGVSQAAVVARDPVALGEALVQVLQADHPSDGRKFIRELNEERVAQKVVEIYRQIAGVAGHLPHLSAA